MFYNDILTHLEQFVSYKLVFMFINKHAFNLVKSKYKMKKSTLNNLFIDVCAKNRLDVAKWLIKLKPNVHYKNDTAYRYAAGKGHFEMIKWLFQFPPREQHWIFYDACLSGNLDLIKFIHKPYHKVDDDRLYLIVKKGHLEVFKYLLDYIPEYSLEKVKNKIFLVLCENGHLEFAKFMLQFKPDVEKIFGIAVERNRYEVVKNLLQFIPNNEIIHEAVPVASKHDDKKIFNLLTQNFSLL